MLDLDSPEWNRLQHAYGSAKDIPDLLRQLTSFPDAIGNAEPWFSLWSALAHQGDVYSASFAAVPHVIAILATAPTEAPLTFFHFPTWVEICRQKLDLTVPPNLAHSYFESLKDLGLIAIRALSSRNDEDTTTILFSAIAIGRGYATLAEVIQELQGDVTAEVLAMLQNR